MTSKFNVRWECEDGYVGKSRPQTCTIDIDDMAESCTTEDEAAKYLQAEVQTDFENKISTTIRNHDEVIEEWRARRERLNAQAEKE
jgi:hypothetical protein